MLRSSEGFHTLTLSLCLDEEKARQLMRDFKAYSQNTGLIKIFPVNGGRWNLNFNPSNGNKQPALESNKNYKVDYYQNDTGIEWLIRYNNWSKEFKSYFIEAKVNPKILGGVKDYVTAATYDDMETAVTNFNAEAKRISPILGNFGHYGLNRIDYCINFSLDELGVTLGSEKVMELIRRGDIPPHYEEWTEYSETSHRMKSKPDSFYLKNPSANINCYSKYMELLKRSEDRESEGLSPIPQTTLDSARNIIRFEVQCKYRKMYTLSNRAREAGNHNRNLYESLLSPEACALTISDYYNKVIIYSDWHTLQEAIHKIRFQRFNKQKETRLIEALQLINQCRSLAKAKALHQGRDLDAFKRTLSDLYGLNINPVTIPKEWGVKRIPNLLDAYGNELEKERLRERDEIIKAEWLKECIKKFGYPPKGHYQ